MPILRCNSNLSKNYKDIKNGNFSSINKSNADVPDQYGNTMLHIASQKGNINLVTHLIELGANIQIKNNKGQTPLDIINNKILKAHGEHNEYTKIARLLIDYNDENNKIVYLTKDADLFEIEFVFLDDARPLDIRNNVKKYIQKQLPGQQNHNETPSTCLLNINKPPVSSEPKNDNRTQSGDNE